MKIKHLRIGIVGAGAMLKYHTAGFRSAGGEVVALMAAHRESAESAARAFGIPRVCDSLDEMLALPDLDAVSIIAPNRFHAPMTLAALKAGKHVFCEKPPAINARDAAKMAAAAARAGRLLMFNFCNRARPCIDCPQAGDRCRDGGSHQFRPGLVDPPRRYSRLWRLVHDA